MERNRTRRIETIIFENFDEMARRILEIWRKRSGEALERGGRFSVALSGGSTPFPFYRLLAEEGRDLPWEHTHIFMVDERYVPPGHHDHNCTAIREVLKPLSLPEENLHAAPTDSLDPLDSAERYEADLREYFSLPRDGSRSGAFPRFDLMLLGMGADGHTASLFPGNFELEELINWTAITSPLEDRHQRLTLTFPVLNNARDIIFHIVGQSKDYVAQEVIERKSALYPASRVQPPEGTLRYFLDREASSMLAGSYPAYQAESS